jgi:hypothetical protein
METLSIRHDIGTLSKEFLRRLSTSNIKFGIAKTLTDLAIASQEEVRKDLPKKFQIRREFVPKGIRIRPASKNNLQSFVYSIDSGGRRDFMARQEFGGIKTPESATGRHIAIPLRAVKPTPQTIVQQGWKPKNLLRMLPNNPNMKNDKKRLAMAQRALAFKVKSKDRPGVEIILMKKGGVYVPAWLLVPAAKVPQREFLAGPSLRAINLNTQRLLRDNLIAALK